MQGGLPLSVPKNNQTYVNHRCLTVWPSQEHSTLGHAQNCTVVTCDHHGYKFQHTDSVISFEGLSALKLSTRAQIQLIPWERGGGHICPPGFLLYQSL